MTKELNIALVSGPAYDALYSSLPEFSARTGIEVNIAFSGDHPALNHHLESIADVPYDLVSTHSKYAPSQLRFLAPLEGVLPAGTISDFVPLLLQLSTVNGSLYGLPRNIDVRLLHYRNDTIADPPATWDELFALAVELNDAPHSYGFVFPGCQSGLFGTFYELAEMAGARLFPADLVPEVENDAGRWALGSLRELYKKNVVPTEFADWHYEQVHECFRSGNAAMVCDWPGYYSLYRDAELSKVSDRFGIAIYPTGPAGLSLSYGGGHTFALTRCGAEKHEALELLLYLTDAEQQLLEARHGCVPVRRSVMQMMQAEADADERARLGMLDKVISEHILIPPKFALYPQVEEVLWRTVQQAILGHIDVNAALGYMRAQIEQIVIAGDGISPSSNGHKQTVLPPAGSRELRY